MKKVVSVSPILAVALGVIALTMTQGITAEPKSMKDILPLPPSLTDAVTGETVPTESLRGKIVALYFSAHWCAPCRTFTPKLIDFHKKNQDDNFEVVFMSLDRSAKMKTEYMKEAGMNWLTAPGQGTREINHVLDYYQLKGVPSLVVFGPDGQVITTKGREDLTSSPDKALQKWRASLK